MCIRFLVQTKPEYLPSAAARARLLVVGPTNAATRAIGSSTRVPIPLPPSSADNRQILDVRNRVHASPPFRIRECFDSPAGRRHTSARANPSHDRARQARVRLRANESRVAVRLSFKTRQHFTNELAMMPLFIFDLFDSRAFVPVFNRVPMSAIGVGRGPLG